MVKRFLQNKGVPLLNNGVWPANSPDLNPVEHVWPMVTRQLKGRVFNTREQLWSALKAAFKAIPPGSIRKLHASMPNRCKAVLAAKGGHTRY